MTNIRLKAARLSALGLVCSLLPLTSLHPASDNRQFVGQGIAVYCDSLINGLGPFAETSVAVDSIGGELGAELRHRLAAGLSRAGISAHLDDHNRGGKLLLQTFVQDATLEYRSVGAGIFRQGRVMRVFTMSGYGRVLDSDGILARSTESLSVSVAYTLDINAARDDCCHRRCRPRSFNDW